MGWAILERKNSPAHKRLMLIATINLMIPAVARWPFLAPQRILLAIRLSLIIPLLMIILFDLVRRRRIHLATLGGGALSLALDPMSALAAGTGLVQNVTAWLTRPG